MNASGYVQQAQGKRLVGAETEEARLKGPQCSFGRYAPVVCLFTSQQPVQGGFIEDDTR